MCCGNPERQTSRSFSALVAENNYACPFPQLRHNGGSHSGARASVNIRHANGRRKKLGLWWREFHPDALHDTQEKGIDKRRSRPAKKGLTRVVGLVIFE